MEFAEHGQSTLNVRAIPLLAADVTSDIAWSEVLPDNVEFCFLIAKPDTLES
jgi:hypothetical protein